MKRNHGVENGGEPGAGDPAIATGEGVVAASPAQASTEKELADVKLAAAIGEGAIVLSDGRLARLRKAKGVHLEQGAAAARDPSNPMSLMMAVVAQVLTIDGERIVYEDVLELDMSDVLKLIGRVSGKRARAVPTLRDQLLIRRSARLSLAEFHELSWDDVLMWLKVVNDLAEEERRATDR